MPKQTNSSNNGRAFESGVTNRWAIPKSLTYR